jgi:PfaD family protein
LEVLAQFGAARTRIWYGEETEHAAGEGGGLADAVERLGVQTLGGLLHVRPDVSALELSDPDVSLRVERAGESATLTVTWSSGASFSETVDVGPVAGLEGHAGPWFRPDPATLVHDVGEVLRAGKAVFAVDSGDGVRLYTGGKAGAGPGAAPLLGHLPTASALGPKWLRDRMGVKACYVAGAMAGGIASAELVIAMGRAGYLGFYGAGGLGLTQVEADIKRIKSALGAKPAGFNLLHNPVEPAMEMATVDLYLANDCRFVSASAFMNLTPAIVKYRFSGAHREGDQVVCPNRVFAKVSRTEVAKHFLAPPPADLLAKLVESGGLTADEAALAATLPVADAITCEADSGGHTDRRPLTVLVPMIKRQRDALAQTHDYAAQGVRVAIGAAGGLGTPESVVAAQALGADYVLTGSINQATPEAGTSDVAKAMLLEAGMADVGEGPAPDMFELGAHVQVLSRGTMYARRGKRLYDLYKAHGSWEEVPDKERAKVEKQILARPFDEIWSECESYWGQRDPSQIKRANTNGRHKMALVFRWYLGMTSRWARLGETKRKRDFQIWCGPSMGAFNEWVAGTRLEPLAARKVVDIADAMLACSQQIRRANALAAQGVELPASAWQARP